MFRDFRTRSPISNPLSIPQVLRLSQFLLLQTAADDALIRLQKSSFSKVEVEFFLNLYYKHQHHRSIGVFLEYKCLSEDHEVFMQVL